MNNEAFQALVRSKVKTTKDIAREAVEEAFARKKKRKRGRGRKRGGDGSDDDGGGGGASSSSESDDDRRPKKQQQLFKPRAARGSDIRQGKNNDDNDQKESKAKASRYRDRARERREGKNEDYQDSEQLLQATKGDGDGERAINQEEISKYLGGDEAHTHLVKGLDVALARSVRQNMEQKQQQNSEESQQQQQASLEATAKPFQSLEEAWKVIEEYQKEFEDGSPMNATPLTRSMVHYLWHFKNPNRDDSHDIQVSAAGAAVQRSRYEFAIDWHPQNIALSWQIPNEKSVAAITTSKPSALPKCSPLPDDIIQEMKQVQSKKKFDITKVQESGKESKVEAEEDSDDDIFSDAGDYSP